MSLSAAIAPHLPFLRRFSRAVSGSQQSGDALVAAMLEADDDALASAKRTLARLGLEPGGYWVACVGGTAHVSIKTWPAEHWGRVLGDWAQRHGRRFLFVGLPEDRWGVAASALSYGDQKLVSIARLLATDATMLLPRRSVPARPPTHASSAPSISSGCVSTGA